MFQCEIFDILFSYKDEDNGRFSNLHWCSFNLEIAFIFKKNHFMRETLGKY